MKNKTGAGPVSPNWTGACFFDIEHLLLTAACRKQTHQVPETTKAPASARAYASGCDTMLHGANQPSGEDRIRTKGTNLGNEQDSVLGAAQSAAVDAQNSPLDPQLQLLIDRWPTLSEKIQQQIILLAG